MDGPKAPDVHAGCKRGLILVVLLTCLMNPASGGNSDPFQHLLRAAGSLGEPRPEADAVESHRAAQERQLERWLSTLLVEGAPRFQRWYSEHDTFATGQQPPDTAERRFPGAPSLPAGQGRSGHAVHGGPLIHFTHFNAAAHNYIRSSSLYRSQARRRMTANGNALPAPPPEAMVALTGWWPLAHDQPTPIPLWDADAALRPTGANGYLNWPRVALVAPADEDRQDPATAPGFFAGRAISDAEVLSPRDFFRVEPSALELKALMRNPQFYQASVIALGRPMQSGDALALVGFHLLHYGLEEGVWLTYWWDINHKAQRESSEAASDDRREVLTAPWDAYRGDMTVSPDYPRETDGSPNICFNPWFDAVFPDSGQGNGLKANCLSCHLRAGIPATNRVQVTRGRPAPDKEDPSIVYTHLLWSLAKPRRTDEAEDDTPTH